MASVQGTGCGSVGIWFVLVAAKPPNRRAGIAMAIEDDRWNGHARGILGEQAPRDEQGFDDFAVQLAAPDVYQLIRDRKPLSDSVLMRFPANQRRR